MTRLVLDVKPKQLVLSKNGGLRVGFFDRLCKVNVKRDDQDREVSSEEIAKLYIHIEIPHDPTTVVIRPVKKEKIVDGENVIFVPESELYTRAFAEYTKLKNEVVCDPDDEIEELKKKLAAFEAIKPEVKAEDIAELESAPKRGRKPAIKEEVTE
jgi:hypothetical protein